MPLAVLAWDGIAHGWRPYEREVMVAAALTPMVAPALAEHANLPLASMVLVALFAVAARRALAAAPVGATLRTVAVPGR